VITGKHKHISARHRLLRH